MNESGARWLVITWRLGADTSTPRVTTWRTLRRIGAVQLSPGAAIVPYGDELLEQLDWLAQGIEESGGEAWVLPVVRLSEREEESIRARMREERAAEYVELREEATRARRPSGRKIGAFERHFARVVARDYFGAPGRGSTRATIERTRRRAAVR